MTITYVHPRPDRRQAMLHSIAVREAAEECAAHAARSTLMTRAAASGDVDSLLPRYAALAGNPLGVGEATLAAAHGDGSHWTEQEE